MDNNHTKELGTDEIQATVANTQVQDCHQPLPSLLVAVISQDLDIVFWAGTPIGQKVAQCGHKGQKPQEH